MEAFLSFLDRHAEILTAIGTLALALVTSVLAVAGDRLQGLFFKPDLVLEERSFEPYCQRIAGMYFFRLLVRNGSRTRSIDTEVRLDKITIRSGGIYANLNQLPPVPLFWSGQPGTPNAAIEGLDSKLVEFAIIEPLPQNTLKFRMASNVNASLGLGVLNAGTYRAHLVIRASNHKPFEKVVSFVVPSTYPPDINAALNIVDLRIV